jgi:hypothetical protein
LKATYTPLKYGDKLRQIDQLCQYNYVYSIQMVKNILSFFDKPSFVLDVEKIDLYHVYQDILPSSLFIGKSLIGNMSWDEDEKKEDLDHMVDNLDKNRVKRVGTIQNNLVRSFINGIFPSSELYPGKGILRLFGDYNFLIHLIYSLMKGRPVIIYGNPEHQDQISDIVNTCAVFVPGRFWVIENEKNLTNTFPTDKSFGILPWSSVGIKNTELSFFKLIGLSKKISIQKSIQRYITIFDFESKTLISPRYNGGMLDSLFNLKKRWPDEGTFIARIHLYFSDIGSKVSLLYNLTMNNMETLVDNKKVCFNIYGIPSRIEEQKDVVKQLSMTASDLEIVEYLVEVIKEQQSRELNEIAPSIKLDFSPCYQFHHQQQGQ